MKYYEVDRFTLLWEKQQQIEFIEWKNKNTKIGYKNIPSIIRSHRKWKSSIISYKITRIKERTNELEKSNLTGQHKEESAKYTWYSRLPSSLKETKSSLNSKVENV